MVKRGEPGKGVATSHGFWMDAAFHRLHQCASPALRAT